jgi:hypothetical protein
MSIILQELQAGKGINLQLLLADRRIILQGIQAGNGFILQWF